MPTLSIVWAKHARVGKNLLAQSQPQALRAVRANLARDPDRFHNDLAWSAVATFSGEFDFDEDVLGPESEEAADSLAEGAGAKLGAELGPFLVNIVAESSLPIASVVRDRIDQLVQLAERQALELPALQEVGRDEGQPSAPEPVGTAPTRESQRPEYESTDPSAPYSYGLEPAEDDDGASLASIERLLEEGPPLAVELRLLADLVESGLVPTSDEADALPRAEAWVLEARNIASDGEALESAADAVRAAMNERAVRRQQLRDQSEKLRELRELREEVEGLLARGRGRIAETLLSANGYSSLDDLRSSIAGFEFRMDGATSPRKVDVHDAEGDGDQPTDDDHDGVVARLRASEGTDGDAIASREHAESSLATEALAGAENLANSGGDPVGPPAAERVSEGLESATTAPGDHSLTADIDEHASEVTEEVDGNVVAESTEQVAAESRSLSASPISADPPKTEVPPTAKDEAGAASPQAPESSFHDSRDVEMEGTVASLIADGREFLAVIAAEALGASEDRVRMLQLFAGAFGSRADTLIAQEPEIVLAEADESVSNADDNRLLFAAHARLALELGFAPVGSLDRFRQFAALEDHPAGELAAEVGRLVARGFKRPIGTLELTALPDDWHRLAESAREKLAALQNMSIAYQRASRIVHYLARENQAVGGALLDVTELARRHGAGERTEDNEWVAIQDLVATLSDRDRCSRLLTEADKAVSTSQQLRKPIIASARERLFSAMEEVATLLTESVALRARAEGSGALDDPQGMANLVAGAQRCSAIEPHSTGDAALGRLVHWLLAEDLTALPPASLSQLMSDELLPLYEIPRDASGAPTRSVPTAEELQFLVSGRDPLVVFDGYLARGNMQAAEMVATRFHLERSISVEEKLAQAGQRLARASRDRIAEVDRVLDRLRSLYDDDLVRQLSQDLEALRNPVPGRYDLQLEPLARIRDGGEARLEEVRSGLRDRARLLPVPAESARILQLLESRDEQLAFDYLNLAESGEPLPVLQPPAGDDFGAFFPAVVRAAEGAHLQRSMDNINEVRKHLGATSNPKDRILARGLKSWNELVIGRGAGSMTEGRLADVLRMIGLIPRDQNWRKELTRAKHAGYATYAVKASPIDRSYVPSLGTQAHSSYDVTIVWDAASPQRLLQYVETNRRTEANIILYLQTMTVEQRLDLRKLTARQGFEFSPVVVDMPIIAWLSTREEPGWRITQRVTLPFTTLNPYTPFAGGEVPDEVFVGRESEQREIIDPTGSMFVYGGRQLGKSALLRRVERGIMRVHEGSGENFEHSQVAVYIDLKSEGIGEFAAPSALWGALGPRLAKLGVLPQNNADWTADRVVSGTEAWLDADSSRRLLLLLDEADNFLTIDAKGTEQSQVGGFPVLQRLKGLMERSGRRFKPVFAGLHQVQRFHGLPNTPVVHGGQDILIGPLKAVDARELVRDPLLALGYEFETPDTMWRLLRLTNYQASLIQIICEALVRHMRSASLPSNGGRVRVTAKDVDDVYSKREVRDLIAQRFRWTINLDSRYRVIALVTARQSLESAPGERFPANELHDECAYFWPAGFSRSTLSSGEFFRYLDEMQGLGVLHRQGDEFGLRSPSILGLLGSKETIEAELLEASDQLEVDYQYNPTMNRRILTHDGSGVETRSPLPDSELASLLDHSRGEALIKVVAGTKALGVHRVTSALERAAAERPVRLVQLDEFTLGDQVAGADDAHVVLDLSSVDAPARRNALAALSTVAGTFATVVLPIDDIPLDPARFEWPVTTLHRWSLAGLQSWNESPFKRQDLRHGTGGWPELVEKAISLVMRGSSTEGALASVTAELSDPRVAREFLASASVPTDIARTWLDAVGFDDGAGDLTIEPASLDYLGAVFEGLGTAPQSIVERLQKLDAIDEVPDGWLLDRVIALAVRSLDE